MILSEIILLRSSLRVITVVLDQGWMLNLVKIGLRCPLVLFCDTSYLVENCLGCLRVVTTLIAVRARGKRINFTIIQSLVLGQFFGD